MTRDYLDESRLVWIAASATKTDAAHVLDTADVAALAKVVAACEATDDAIAEAAAAITATIDHQPFAASNRAVAFLAAAYVLEAAGFGTRQVASELADLVRRNSEVEPRLRALISADAAATAVRYLPYPCPACGRALRYREEELGPNNANFVGTSRFELTARCWYEHRVHDRSGTPLRAPARAEHVGGTPAVVTSPSGDVVIELRDEGAVVIHDSHIAAVLDDLDPGDLVGDWERLRARLALV